MLQSLTALTRLQALHTPRPSHAPSRASVSYAVSYAVSKVMKLFNFSFLAVYDSHLGVMRLLSDSHRLILHVQDEDENEDEEKLAGRVEMAKGKRRTSVYVYRIE